MSILDLPEYLNGDGGDAEFDLWNRDGRLYRLVDLAFTPELGCTWCGDVPGAGDPWMEPATQGGEFFCGLRCFDADTEQCWDAAPGLSR